MHKQESVLENEIHKIVWDFEIDTNLSIILRKAHIELIKKKKGFYIWWMLLFKVNPELNKKKWKEKHIVCFNLRAD